jgi:hypothetical protein
VDSHGRWKVPALQTTPVLFATSPLGRGPPSGRRPCGSTKPLATSELLLPSLSSPTGTGGRGAQDYKRLDGKVVSVEELEGKDAGVRAVKEAMDLYTAMVVRDLQS